MQRTHRASLRSGGPCRPDESPQHGTASPLSWDSRCRHCCRVEGPPCPRALVSLLHIARLSLGAETLLRNGNRCRDDGKGPTLNLDLRAWERTRRAGLQVAARVEAGQSHRYSLHTAPPPRHSVGCGSSWLEMSPRCHVAQVASRLWRGSSLVWLVGGWCAGCGCRAGSGLNTGQPAASTSTLPGGQAIRQRGHTSRCGAG